MLTNLQLVEYMEKVYAAAWRYWYGTCGYKCTEDLYERKKKQYPDHYGSSRTAAYKTDIASGAMCADCVGVIKSFFWTGGVFGGVSKYGSNNCPDRSANGLFGMCKETGDISTIPDIPGLVVWKSGHIGVYVGGGRTIELKGFNYDCVKVKVTSGPWKKWGKLPASMLAYVGDGAGTTEPAVPEPAAYELGDRILKRGMKGSDVTELQTALVALGFDCGTYGVNEDGIDGDYGKATEKAVKAFQEAAGVEIDGHYGPKSHAAMLAMQNAAPVEYYTVTVPHVNAATATYLLENYEGARAVKEGAT